MSINTNDNPPNLSDNKASFLTAVFTAMQAHGITDALIIYRLEGQIHNTALSDGTNEEWANNYAILSDQLADFFARSTSWSKQLPTPKT